MSNLTDLLPSGAGGKQVSFTASGSISSGQTVGLNSDGTVSVIAEATGTATQFETGGLGGYGYNAVYDSTNNKVVVFYSDTGDNNNGKAAVGTVSGTSISFGTPVEFKSNVSNVSCSFDSNAGKCLVVCYDNVSNIRGFVGTVSGTSISFGSEATLSGQASFIAVTYDENAQKHLVVFRDDGNSQYGTSSVATISGTSVSFGSKVVYNSQDSSYNEVGYDANAQKLLVAWHSNSDYDGRAIVGTISGTSVSYGSNAAFNEASSGGSTVFMSMTYDSNAQKILIAYTDETNNNYLSASVATISGTSVSFGTKADLGGSTVGAVNGWPSAVYSPDDQTIKIVVGHNQSPYNLFHLTATISGTSVTGTTPQVLYVGASTRNDSVVYDTSSNQYIVAVRDASGNFPNDSGVAFVVGSGSGASPFIGIADAAISNAASGKVTLKGGIASSGLSSLTPGSTYYVQDDGTLSTTSSSVTAGKALSGTSINLEYNS